MTLVVCFGGSLFAGIGVEVGLLVQPASVRTKPNNASQVNQDVRRMDNLSRKR
jgi:hypothetical protein